MIDAAWGNGTDVIIRYKRGNGLWYAASKWLQINFPYTDKYLKKLGYTRIEV